MDGCALLGRCIYLHVLLDSTHKGWLDRVYKRSPISAMGKYKFDTWNTIEPLPCNSRLPAFTTDSAAVYTCNTWSFILGAILFGLLLHPTPIIHSSPPPPKKQIHSGPSALQFLHTHPHPRPSNPPLRPIPPPQLCSAFLLRRVHFTPNYPLGSPRDSAVVVSIKMPSRFLALRSFLSLSKHRSRSVPSLYSFPSTP